MKQVTVDWTTEDEIRFINGLGTGKHIEKSRGGYRLLLADGQYKWMPEEDMRSILLKSYIETAKIRSKWGKINKQAVIEHAILLLQKVKDGMAAEVP